MTKAVIHSCMGCGSWLVMGVILLSQPWLCFAYYVGLNCVLYIPRNKWSVINTVVQTTEYIYATEYTAV